MKKDRYSFLEVSEETKKKVSEITRRAMLQNLNFNDSLSLEMDLLFAHQEFNLRLDDLLEADDFNFHHDIYGIQISLDRRKLKFINHFVPRYSNLAGK